LVFLTVSLPLDFSPTTYTRSSFPPFGLHAPPISPPCRNYSNNTWRRVQTTKLLIMQFSPPSCHFIRLWSKCPPQHRSRYTVIRNFQSGYLLSSNSGIPYFYSSMFNTVPVQHVFSLNSSIF
jgi:hypothetical protein